MVMLSNGAKMTEYRSKNYESQKGLDSMNTAMNIASYRAKGSARDVLQIRAIETPSPQAGEVLIRLHYSGINPSDVKMRAGLSLGGMAMPFDEVIPHSDGAGVIEALGDGVSDFSIGDRVFVFNAGFKRAFGTAAEAITIPAAQVVPLPDQTSMTHGACLGIPAMTAVHAMTRAKSIDGKRVLISSGGGVVGRYCIEVARGLGAKTIITTASSPLSRATAEKAGADLVLDYKSDRLAEEIQDHCGQIDHAVEAEFGVNAQTLGTVMAEGGSIAAYGSALNKTPEIPFYDFMFKNITLHMLLVYLLDDETRKADLAVIKDLLTRGAITENIAAILPLDDIATAHEQVEAAQKSGSVLLDCQSSSR